MGLSLFDNHQEHVEIEVVLMDVHKALNLLKQNLILASVSTMVKLKGSHTGINTSIKLHH